jgi:hypothetical protein
MLSAQGALEDGETENAQATLQDARAVAPTDQLRAEVDKALEILKKPPKSRGWFDAELRALYNPPEGNMMKTKALHGLKITDEPAGKVQAIFATLNVKDSDGDVTLPGAFKGNPPVRISAWNHASWGAGFMPVGKGTIREAGENAIFDGEFFMDTTQGRDAFHTVKALDELGEWSYGYDTLEAEPGTHEGEKVQFLKKQLVHEVSPVILGAGIGTRTLAMKSALGGKLAGDELRDALKTYTLEELLAALPVGDGQKLLEQLTHTDGLVKAAVDRLADVVALRVNDGKKLADDTKDAAEQLLATAERIREVLTIEPQQKATTISIEWREAKAREARALELLSQGATPS